jgi:hypothetical protein
MCCGETTMIGSRRSKSWMKNVYFGLGNPGGSGFRVGKGPDGKMGKCKGQFTSNLRERWTNPITARRVPSKWKKE